MSSESKELGGPRLGRIGLFVILCALIPAAFLNDWTLDQFQQRVINVSSEKPWSADAQRWVAHAFAFTLRHKKAADRYEWAGDLYARHSDFTTAGEMYFDQAKQLEKTTNGKYFALPIYERLEKDYKEYPVGARAQGAVVRLKTMSRP